MLKNNAIVKQNIIRNNIFQNTSPLTFTSLPIKALHNVVIEICIYIPRENKP